MAALQQRFAQLAAVNAGVGTSTKRAGESAQALLAVKRVLVQNDEELSTPDYREYMAAA